MKRIALFAFFVANALNCAANAVTLSSTDEPARDAALQWLQLIDAGRFEEAASQGAQELFSFEQWINRCKAQRAAVGRMNRRQFAEAKRTSMVSGIPDVRRYYLVRFTTSFERVDRKSTRLNSSH